MTRYFRLLAILLCLSLAPLSSAFADAQKDFERGEAAYSDGKYSQAVKWWRKAAEQGDARAQYNLGQMHREGQGVPQDYAEAVKWYRKAAEQGHASAQFSLGDLLRKGQGVPQNYLAAHMWFNLAAAQGQELAVGNRDNIAKEMTPQQISQAQTRAAACKQRNYKFC